MEDILPEFKSVIFGQTDSERYFFFYYPIWYEQVFHAMVGVDDIATLVTLNDVPYQRFSLGRRSRELASKANYLLTNGHELFARGAGLELYFSTRDIALSH